jgi:hypothetical protein
MGRLAGFSFAEKIFPGKIRRFFIQRKCKSVMQAYLVFGEKFGGGV